MIRAFLLVVLSMLSVPSLVLADCTAGFEYEFGEREVSLSVPARLARRVVEKLPVVGQIISLVKVEITFLETWHVAEAVCRCVPCCQHPSFQHLGVSIVASTESITWSDTLVATRPGESPPVDPCIGCETRTQSRTYQAGTKVEVGVDLPVRFDTWKAQMAIRAAVSCKCTDNPECEGNVPPTVLPFGPVELNHGEEAEFNVSAVDPGPRPNLSHFLRQMISEGCLTAHLKQAYITEDARSGWATYRMSYTGGEELLKSCVSVGVVDKCGSSGGYMADVRIQHPPAITPDPQSRWDRGQYMGHFTISDPNLRGCDEPWEAVTLSVREVTCGTYHLSQNVISCLSAVEGSGATTVVFRPQRDCCDRGFTLQAVDLGGLQDMYRLVVPPRPLQVSGPLTGTASVALTPGGDVEVLSPAVLDTVDLEPVGETLVMELNTPPRYAETCSFFIGSVGGYYVPSRQLNPGLICHALCEGDALLDEFSALVRDACGAELEVPITVMILLENVIPPELVTPAKDELVACDSKGNMDDFATWLAAHGGAEAQGACGLSVTWAHEIGEFVPGCGGTGAREVTFVAVDRFCNEVETRAFFRIDDTTPPVLTLPESVTVECNESTDPANTGWAMAEDICAPDAPIVVHTDSVEAGGCPHAWTITRTATATDACGNSASGKQTITVVDTAPPALTIPEDVELGCTPADVSPDTTGMATASDNCDPEPVIAYSDAITHEGCTVTIEREWAAVDACGNASKGLQRVTYTEDTTPPVLAIPADADLGCNPDASATEPSFTGWAAASDMCAPTPTVFYTDASTYEGCLVTIERTWEAMDHCGNSAQDVQRIRYVRDTAPPVILCPPEIAVLSSEPQEGLVWIPFPIGAEDNCDLDPGMTCTPVGGWFPTGTASQTQVLCTATDHCGNTTDQLCSFTVTVESFCPPLIASDDAADCIGWVRIPVLANDSGFDLQIVSITSPDCGTAWIDGDAVCYTTAGWVGHCPPPGPGIRDQFDYVVEDACGNRTTARVFVRITCEICPLSVPGGLEVR